MPSRRFLLKGLAATAALGAAPFSARAQGQPIANNRAANTSDVIVIGAGLSGLYATLLLEELGYKVTLLEGTKRIGGRLYTAPESEVPGAPEMGGSGIGHGYARLLDMCTKYGVKLGPHRPRTEVVDEITMLNIKGQNIQLKDWEASKLNPFEGEARKQFPWQYQFGVFAKYNPLKDTTGWMDEANAKFDVSVFEFLRGQGVSAEAIRLGSGTNMSYGTNEYDLSVLMWFHILANARAQASFGRGSMAGEGGNQRIPEGMAKGLKTEILFDRAVVGIRANEKDAEVVTYDGTVYRAKRVISTMPFTALRHVRVDPVTEGAQADAINNLGYTQAFQVHYVPTRKYWEEDGLPPSMWTDGKPGRFMALRNDTARPDEVTSVLSYVNGQDAIFLDKLDPNVAAEYILHEVAKMRPATKGALKPVKIWSWQRNIFGGGPYAAWQPGQITRLAKELGKPWKTLHIAGEHTAISNRGMEGAMESGERAALEVAALL